MSTSQNGYPVMTNRTTGALPRLRKWAIPGTSRTVLLRDGAAGFLLVHLFLWFHERIEPIDRGAWDEWGWANRAIRGSTVTSNHASGTAGDMNASLHPLGKRGTFSRAKTAAIRLRLKLYRAAIRWGGDYQNRADEMHFELADLDLVPFAKVNRIAKRLALTPRGRKILAANPGARSVIFS